MNFKSVAIVPAMLALGLFVAMPASAEPEKNGGGAPVVDSGGGKNGGGDGGGKNGGGGNGHGHGHGNGHGGSWNHGGHGGGHGGGSRGGGRRVTVINGGGGDITLSRKCYLGHAWIYVSKKEECYMIGGSLTRGGRSKGHGYSYAYGGGGGYVGGGMVGSYGGSYAVGGSAGCNCSGYAGSGGYAIGGGYGYYGQQPIIRYVPTSRAAAMQMERRAKKAARKAAAAGYGYYGGGYAYGGGYGQGGYAYGGGYAYEGEVVVQPRKKKRRIRHHQMHPAYNPYVMMPHAPVVTKGGSY